jgi:DNA phosphorothioation-dependent restriction protein DptH
MDALISLVVSSIEARLRSDSLSCLADGSQRWIFSGPPEAVLQGVLRTFEASGGVCVTSRDGVALRVPVLLPLPEMAGRGNPPVNSCGFCDESFPLQLRNTPSCSRFLVLSPAGAHTSLSVLQATVAFGLDQEVNAGGTPIEAWWADAYVQDLVDRCVEGLTSWKDEDEREEARELLQAAIRESDDAARHATGRVAPWAVLARLSTACQNAGLATLGAAAAWSLACGHPAPADGCLSRSLQQGVLARVMELFVSEGRRRFEAHLAGRAEQELLPSIRALCEHLAVRSRVPAGLLMTQSPSVYFAPSNDATIAPPPEWWSVLDTRVLGDLLGEQMPPTGVALTCRNPLVAAGGGLPWIVEDMAEVQLRLVSDAPALPVTVKRTGGGRTQTWELLPDALEPIADDSLPPHTSPLTYSASGQGYKKATLRVVSLAAWEPGMVLCCRSATKTTLPSPNRGTKNIDFESSLVVSGEGRHFVEVYTSPGWKLADIEALTDASLELQPTGTISSFAKGLGIEITATKECKFTLTFKGPRGSLRRLRLDVAATERPTERSRTEFERLVLANKAKVGSAAPSVNVDRQPRLAQLEAELLLAPAGVDTCFPLAMSENCSTHWQPPVWGTMAGSLLSRGDFLHDPRPSRVVFAAPQELLRLRADLCQRILGPDHNGMIQDAPLGLWMGEETPSGGRDWVFGEHVHAYLEAYNKWLREHPEDAAWADVIALFPLERDGRLFGGQPDALIMSPLHPVRLAWMCNAQRILHEALIAGTPCPAASVLDPDSIPDSLTLPLRSPDGGIEPIPFLAMQCSSDYWSVLWNAKAIRRIHDWAGKAPFDDTFGISLGGLSGGFSVSQVQRSLSDVSTELLPTKAIVNVLISQSAVSGDACNEGVTGWARTTFAADEEEETPRPHAGRRELQVFDRRPASMRPEDADLANLTEDTGGRVRWYSRVPANESPDLGIIPHLEAASQEARPMGQASSLSRGALLRQRIRTQLKTAGGAFLRETRSASSRPPSGEALGDLLVDSVVRLENLEQERIGYTFAPSVQEISRLFQDDHAEFVSVSSAAVDPACFLGKWLADSYLWDYELPSYSHRAGDVNGYYLLAQVRDRDCTALGRLFAQLPGGSSSDSENVRKVLLEVARRGIPTVRGLAARGVGASGNLGLFLAGRLLQDSFRVEGADTPSLLPVSATEDGAEHIALVVPVDPFRGYLGDLQRSAGQALANLQRPDLVVITLSYRDAGTSLRVVPVEVKYRRDEMPARARAEALEQARAFSRLLCFLREGAGSDVALWKLAFQHLLLSMLDFGFRVYSQQPDILSRFDWWARLHERAVSDLLHEEMDVQVDQTGRLLVFDATALSGSLDGDGDGFDETIQISHEHSSAIAHGDPAEFYSGLRSKLGSWSLYPHPATRPAVSPTNIASQDAPGTQGPSPTVVAPSGVGEPDSAPHPAAAAGVPSPEPEPAPAVAGNREEGRSTPLPPKVEEPAQVGEIEVHVGETVDGFRNENRYFLPSDTRLNQLNVGVVGDLGTGKTQLLKAMILQLAESQSRNRGVAPNILIFDYKRDYSAADFVNAVGAKVFKPKDLPLNFFDISGVADDTMPWMSRFRFFADVLAKLYAGIGPVQRERLRKAVKAAYDSAGPESPTLYEVRDAYAELVGDNFDAPLSIISEMAEMQLFESDRAKLIDFPTFSRGVVVISLDALGQDDRTKNMVVAIMLNMFYEHMLRIEKRPFLGTTQQTRFVDSFLLVDEADNIMKHEFDVLRKLLLQGREFGVGVILASQYLSHFSTGGTDYREPLLSWFIHKVPNVTPQQINAIGLTADAATVAARVRALPNHHFLYKTVDVPGQVVNGLPFFQLERVRRAARPPADR